MKTLVKPRIIFVHLLVHDPDGPIPAANTNLRVACCPDSGIPESASTVALETVITCPLCLASEDYRELNELNNSVSAADSAAAKHVSNATSTMRG